MRTATTLDAGIPPAWNAAVMEIRQANVEEKPNALPTGFRSCRYLPGNALSTANITPGRSIEALGWTPAEALETYLRLRAFAEDWDAPGMEAYDDL